MSDERTLRIFASNRRRSELEFNRLWGDLARFNAEVARGIQHTSDYKAAMAIKQARYNREVLGL